MKKILLVEDNEAIQKGLKYSLEQEKFVVELASDVKTAKDKLVKSEFNLIILDVMLPDGSGFELCRDIKKNMTTPILFLTAKDEEQDVVNGFDFGADDYVVKPFSPKELIARVNAVISRNKASAPSDSDELSFGGLVINMPARTVTIDGEKAELTPKEYELLFYLVKNRNLALSRDKLLQDIWGYDFFGDDRTIDTHIKNLRNNLGPYRDYIVTLRGVGYKFEVEN